MTKSAGSSVVETPLRIGISSCLLGESVRFDGGHKRDTLLTESLGRFVTWVPVCPELEIGLGVPRESLRLIGTAAEPRLVASRSGLDHTSNMQRYAERRVSALSKLDLDGYILKKDSPSCGMERVRVYDLNGSPTRDGRGCFAAVLMKHMPLLPVEEEGRLHDLVLRENFVERVFARRRWRQFLQDRPTPARLVAFHTRQKMALLAHCEPTYRKMGRCVAGAGRASWGSLLREYEQLYFEALAVKATPRKHANVLFHLMGFVKADLDSGDKAELVDCVEGYRRGRVPLVVPITLLKHHLRRHPVDWVLQQTYLNPYPEELMLRNQT